MPSAIVLDELVPNLSAPVIDALMFKNRTVLTYFERNRIKFDYTLLDELDILPGYDDKSICLRIHNEKQLCLKNLPVEETMLYLAAFRTKKLYLKYDILCRNIDTLWLKTVEEIEIMYVENKPELSEFLKYLDCHSVEFYLSTFTFDGDEILNRMPYVTCFSACPVKFSSQFLPDLKEKTLRGPGVKCIKLGNLEEHPINLNQFVEFIMGAKFLRKNDPADYFHFNASCVKVNYVTGTESEFLRRLNAVDNDDEGQWTASRIRSRNNKMSFEVENLEYIFIIEIEKFMNTVVR